MRSSSLCRQQLGVDADAALGAAERQVHRGGLDRHPGRQRHHFFQRDVRVVAHAALARAARQVVLHAEAFEVGDGAVVELDGHVDDQRALRALEGLDPARQVAQVGHHAIESKRDRRARSNRLGHARFHGLASYVSRAFFRQCFVRIQLCNKDILLFYEKFFGFTVRRIDQSARTSCKQRRWNYLRARRVNPWRATRMHALSDVSTGRNILRCGSWT
jgi:hypothetical protein